MKLVLLLVLIILGTVFLEIGQAWFGIVLFLLAFFVFLEGFLGAAGKGARAAGKYAKKEIGKEAKAFDEAKPSHPKGEVFVEQVKVAGKKFSEVIPSKPEEKYVFVKSTERVSQGAKNFFEMLGKIFFKK